MVPGIPDELVEWLRTLISPPDASAFVIVDLAAVDWAAFGDETHVGLIVRGTPTEEQSKELKRVLKPGGHLVLIAPETEPTGHTGTCRIEDAGFEIRDAILLVDEPGNFHYVPKASRSEREAGCSGLGSKKDQDGNPGVVKNHHPCLHPDALVLTLQGGYQPIGKVKIDDLVYSADGCFHLVDDVSRHIYTASCLYDIKIQGTNYSTPASDNHPFLIWRPQREKKSIVGGEVGWIEAKDLRKGDYTMTPLCHEFPIYVEGGPLEYPTDMEFWFMFGLYLADGVLQKAGHGLNCYPSFTLGTDKPDLINLVRDYFEKRCKVSIYPKLEDNAVQLMVFDADAGQIFQKHGGKLAKSKTLSPYVISSSKEIKTAILEGYLAGDGCQVKNRLYKQAKTISPKLACWLTFLADSIGYKTGMFHYPPAEGKGIGLRKFKTTNMVYQLYFYSQNQTRQDRKNSRPTYVIHQGVTYLLRYIKAVDPMPYVGDVVNLTVQGSPTFQTIVGMSHNTVKPSALMEKLLGDIPIDAGPVLDCFMGSGSTGLACVKTGHDFIGIDMEPDYVGIATARIRHQDQESNPWAGRVIETEQEPELEAVESLDDIFGW